MAFSSSIVNRLKKITEKQKILIKDRIEEKGEIPWFYQFVIALLFWLLLFTILFIIWNPSTRWIVIILAVVGAYVMVEGVNYLIKKRVNKGIINTDNQLENQSINMSLEEIPKTKFNFDNRLIVNSTNKYGGIVLVQKERGKYILTPYITLCVISIFSTTPTLLSKLSSSTLKKLSLDYNFTLIDSSRYEIFLLKGKNLISNQNQILQTIKALDIIFFAEANKIITEIQEEKLIIFENPSDEIFKELFPSFHLLKLESRGKKKEEIINLKESIQEEIMVRDKNPDENENVKLIEHLQKLESEELQVPEVFLENSLDSDETESEDCVSRDQYTTEKQEEQKNMIREILQSELDFSLERFIVASKGFYKKTIEKELKRSYIIDLDKFLKIVHLFCEKIEIKFFYPSYSFLLRIIEFLDIELPTSTDIQKYIRKLSEELVSVKLSTEMKKRLTEFLDSKIIATEKKNSQSVLNHVEKFSTIPSPPTNSCSDGEFGGDTFD